MHLSPVLPFFTDNINSSTYGEVQLTAALLLPVLLLRIGGANPLSARSEQPERPNIWMKKTGDDFAADFVPSPD